MQRFDNSNGHGRDLSSFGNGHGAEIRRRAQQRARFKVGTALRRVR